MVANVYDKFMLSLLAVGILFIYAPHFLPSTGASSLLELL